MEIVFNKIAYGVKPNLIELVFPDNDIHELTSIYEDFFKNHYDKAISFEKLKKKKNEEYFSILDKIYDSEPDFFEIFPADISFSKEYKSAISFLKPFGKKENTLEDITSQFVKYLWNNNIPVAQHLAVTLNDEIKKEFDIIENYQREQED